MKGRKKSPTRWGSDTLSSKAGLGLDEWFRRVDSATTRDFLSDALRSSVALADTSGTVQTEYTYSPFGSTTSNGASTTNASEFTGRENDGTGLLYYRARYYDAVRQRFIGEDPIGVNGGLNLLHTPQTSRLGSWIHWA